MSAASNKKMDCEKPRNAASAGMQASVNSAVVSTPTANTSSQLAGDSSYPLKPSFLTGIDGIANTITGGIEKAASAMDATTKRINNVDCSDMLYEYIMSKLPPFTATLINGASKGLDKAANFAHGITSGASIGNLIRKPDFVKNVCTFIEMWGGTIDGWLDVIVKAAFALFNKIDAARERLENATLDFTEAVRNCVLDVINAIQDKLNGLLNFTMAINWDDLGKYMAKCPCLANVIAYLTGCTEDADGNPTKGRPWAIIACINEKFSFLNVDDLKFGLDTMITKYVKNFINGLFNLIEAWIVYVYDLVIKPFRFLMKKYVELLTKKMNVDKFIDTVGPFECFFVYTEEYQNGKKYYGMSAIDMIKTYKGWIGCLEIACPNLSEKIKNRTKQMYKDLRLEDKYWRRAMEADIYTCCLATELDAPTARESVLRQLYFENPWDWLLSLFKKAKNKDDNTSEADAEAEEYDVSRPFTFADLHPSEGSSLGGSIKDAINFTYSVETENEVMAGPKKISKFEENTLKSIVGSMSSQTDDNYYVEHMYQLVRFSNNYATSEAYIQYVSDKLDSIESLSGNYSSSDNGMNNSSVRQPYYVDNPTGYPTADGSVSTPAIVATYTVPSDFDQTRSEKISYFQFTPQASGETLANYYARMYQSAVRS